MSDRYILYDAELGIVLGWAVMPKEEVYARNREENTNCTWVSADPFSNEELDYLLRFFIQTDWPNEKGK